MLLIGDEIGVIFFDDGGLEFYNVNVKDIATYKCVVINVVGEIEYLVDFYVFSIIFFFLNNS